MRSTSSAWIPISSCVSRMAVEDKLSSDSFAPPGNEICPRWCSTFCVRFVNVKQISPFSSNNSIKTADWIASFSVFLKLKGSFILTSIRL